MWRCGVALRYDVALWLLSEMRAFVGASPWRELLDL
jgi:hypothetical protein